MKLRNWTRAAIFAAMIAILAQISIPIPFSPVPITGQTLAVGIVATIFPWRQSLLTIVIYLLLGAVGIPVYAGLSAGLGVLLGPTGGYLWSFLLSAVFISIYVERVNLNFFHATIANVIGCFMTLFIGTIWLKLMGHYSWAQAFIYGFTPFVILGIVKSVLAAWLGVEVRRRLAAAKLLNFN